MHLPQSIHRSLRMVALPLRTRMASVGQFLMQVVHPRQRLYSRMTECFIMVDHPVSKGRPDVGRPVFQLMWIFMVTVVPTPTWVSICMSSEQRFMLGRPIPAPKPRSRATSPAVEKPSSMA